MFNYHNLDAKIVLSKLLTNLCSTIIILMQRLKCVAVDIVCEKTRIEKIKDVIRYKHLGRDVDISAIDELVNSWHCKDSTLDSWTFVDVDKFYR